MTARTATGQRAGPRTPGPVRLSKNQRQHLVAKLLAQHAVTSQDQLVVLLAAERVTATQATVSRDLDDLGAIKVRADRGEPVYAIPDLTKDQRAPDDLLRRTLSDWVVEVASSANLVVLRTPPGTVTSWARPWTGPPYPGSWVPSPAMTRSWWWPTTPPEDRPWPPGCEAWPA